MLEDNIEIENELNFINKYCIKLFKWNVLKQYE